MPCELNRDKTGRVVVFYLQDLGYSGADESSNFTTDLRANPDERRTWAAPIRDLIEDRDCAPGSFGPDDCARANTVRDIADALWKAMGGR